MANIPKEEYQERMKEKAEQAILNLRLVDVQLVDDLDQERKRKFYWFCNYMFNNEFFKMIIKEHITAQSDAAVMKAENYDIVTFHRAVIVAFSLIDEFFKKNAAAFESLSQEEKKILTKDDPQRFEILDKSNS